VDLLIIPDEEEVKEKIEDTGSTNYRDWYPDNWCWNAILWECLEPYLCNGWTILDPRNTGDLTEGLLITDGNKVWWDGDYMVRDLLEVTLTEHRGYKLEYVREMTDDQYGEEWLEQLQVA
jgi:hypothetical protein